MCHECGDKPDFGVVGIKLFILLRLRVVNRCKCYECPNHRAPQGRTSRKVFDLVSTDDHMLILPPRTLPKQCPIQLCSPECEECAEHARFPAVHQSLPMVHVCNPLVLLMLLSLLVVVMAMVVVMVLLLLLLLLLLVVVVVVVVVVVLLYRLSCG